MVIAVFAVVYLGMFLGELPRLQVDRAGVALLGAIALLVTGAAPLERAIARVDVATLALLFGMTVLSAQLRLGGVYHALVVRAVAPAAVGVCRRRGLDPTPFLLAVACAANVGSAATLVGNPQNILVGQTLGLSFAGYLGTALAPAALGLGVVWGVVARAYRGRWRAQAPLPSPSVPDGPPFHRWQAAKGLALTTMALLGFLFAPWPRELVALAAAGVVLTSRRFHTRETLELVD